MVDENTGDVAILEQPQPGAATPPPAAGITLIRPQRGWLSIDWRELWRYRELFVFLAWRDILVRYKQTAIGVMWAVIQPVMTMVIFTVVFGRLANLPSEGAPYAVMTFAALLPWQFFSSALGASSGAVAGAGGLISKVYFPRLIIPVASTISGMADFLVSFVILIGLMLWFGVPFRPHLLLLPAFFLVAFAAALSVGFWFGALNVKYRDVRHLIPFAVRMGVYISPVGFMSSVIPERWRFWYSLNPMVGAIDGFRWAILGPSFEPYWPGFFVSLAVVLVLLVGGAHYFRAMEKTFADVI